MFVDYIHCDVPERLLTHSSVSTTGSVMQLSKLCMIMYGAMLHLICIFILKHKDSTYVRSTDIMLLVKELPITEPMLLSLKNQTLFIHIS